MGQLMQAPAYLASRPLNPGTADAVAIGRVREESRMDEPSL
jgi:hypothetical protein